MSPDVKLETHAKCGGIAVSVPSGSVNGGTVLFCIKCLDEQIERFRDALLAIKAEVESDPMTPIAATSTLGIVRGALGA
jgi:hypothetical protein